MNRNEQKALNEKHSTNPEPGDYWQEMGVGICAVLEVRKNGVTICRKKINFPDEDKWSWDFDKVEYLTKEEFKKWLSYDAIEGYWADVMPGHHKWAVTYFKKLEDTD